MASSENQTQAPYLSCLDESEDTKHILQDGHHDLLHQGTEVLQGVGVDVPAGHVIQELLSRLRQRLSLPLDKKYPLVPVFYSCICRYKITIIWSIFGVQLRKSRGYI